MKHTKGPWRIGNCPSYDGYTGKPYRNIWAGDGDAAQVIARAIDYGDVDANAALVAAAPDLLEALKGVLRVADRKTVEFDAARAAIAKAEGKETAK